MVSRRIARSSCHFEQITVQCVCSKANAKALGLGSYPKSATVRTCLGLHRVFLRCDWHLRSMANQEPGSIALLMVCSNLGANTGHETPRVCVHTCTIAKALQRINECNHKQRKCNDGQLECEIQPNQTISRTHITMNVHACVVWLIEIQQKEQNLHKTINNRNTRNKT